jgi:hypothetical protein
MLAELFGSASRERLSPASQEPFTRPRRDAAFAARPRLLELREDLLNAARQARPRKRLWGEPPVFFFDPARQAELKEARPAAPAMEVHPLAGRLAQEVAELCESVEVRQAARAIPGLREAAALLPVARDLAALLAIADEETVLALHPSLRAGYRLSVSGVANANQFQLLMLDALADEGLAPALPSRFASACRDSWPTTPAGIPMVAELPFQLLRPEALRTDGSIDEGFESCGHWLWGGEALAVLPRIDGERVIILGKPAYRRTWEVERRFPTMAAEVALLDILSPFQVAERLGRIVGQTVSVRVHQKRGEPALARAA